MLILRTSKRWYPRNCSVTEFPSNDCTETPSAQRHTQEKQEAYLPFLAVQEDIPRVPIVCTGNDFSTLYAPLIRDGRMEKFYWAPTREDRVGVCMGIFQHDGVTRGEVETIVDTFPGQSIDFFGALRVSHPSLMSHLTVILTHMHGHPPATTA